MIDVDGAAVAEYLGRGDEPETVALAGVHAQLVTEWVRTYTRGVGFYPEGIPEDPIAAVIISATARLTQNPDSTITVTVDDYSARKTVFEGFTLIERAVLDAYRRKTA